MIEASAKKRRMMIGALNKTSKKIAMIDLKTKDVIKQFAGAAEAGRYLKIDASGISRCACGKQKSAGGYIWKYL